MPSFLERLRLKNIFDSQMSPDSSPDMSMGGPPGAMDNWQTDMSMGGAPDIATPTIEEPGTPSYDVGKRMKELYSPSTNMSDRLNTMLNQYPQREKASLLRKIGAGLTASQFGYKAGNDYLDSPFNEKLADWTNQVKPIEQAANLERYHNTNERTMAYQTVSQELKQQAEEHKVAKDEAKAKIAEHRANIYDYKAKHPAAKFVMPKGGNVQILDPATNKLTDTGIPTGSMSEIDKLNLIHAGQMENIDERGINASDLEAEKQPNRLAAIAARVAGAKDVKSTPSGNAPGGKTLLPTQVRVQQATAAKELYNSDPELRPFIKIGQGNDFEITPPSPSGFFSRGGPTPEQYQKIKDKIYGAMPDIKQPGRTGATPTNTPKVEPAVEPGRKVVIDIKTGKEIGTIPETDVAKLDKTKYKVK